MMATKRELIGDLATNISIVIFAFIAIVCSVLYVKDAITDGEQSLVYFSLTSICWLWVAVLSLGKRVGKIVRMNRSDTGVICPDCGNTMTGPYDSIMKCWKCGTETKFDV